ncbi:hypothetical protein [Chromobacterium sp. Beijing]|uniref:hypothetical protein n=1 Tax=Chromobacterium sp. Beijing TaxID=2735795 RepID=UPI001F2B95CE|nr:hypothetical protein [Chromobacterium sp. Beijing]UJB31697.1 phospholipase [Chromobacterium sp. Beijing]
MSTTYTPPVDTIPMRFKDGRTVQAHASWFICDTEYPPDFANYTPLVNGERAFAAVHQAIANAQRSVDIVCWGFQPSMHFVRVGSAPAIGALLEQKARAGVQVRVLGWTLEPFGISVTGAVGEANMPGKNPIAIMDRRQSTELDPDEQRQAQQEYDAQLQTDRAWFRAYDRKQPALPLRFVGRGFSLKDRIKIFKNVSRADLKALDDDSNTLDRDLGLSSRLVMAGVPSHHQKMVLVDYEDDTAAIGFVMGHNMLDGYWDNDAHSRQRQPHNRGRNGAYPMQDLSCQLSGPILEYLHLNFAQAWQKETGEDLLGERDAQTVGECLERVFRQQKLPTANSVMAQILRTQPQENTQDIETLYLHTVGNATQYIYIENQYFRWPVLAERILKNVRTQTECGRDCTQHGQLHLFVVTNASDDGMGRGGVNTYRMLDALGRADTLPAVARTKQLEQLEQRLEAARQAERTGQTLPPGQSAADLAAQLEEARQAKIDEVSDSQEIQQLERACERRRRRARRPDPAAGTKLRRTARTPEPGAARTGRPRRSGIAQPDPPARHPRPAHPRLHAGGARRAGRRRLGSHAAPQPARGRPPRRRRPGL